MGGKMNEPWMDQYRTDGFCMLPAVLPPDLIDAHVGDCERVRAGLGLTGKPAPGDGRLTEALLGLNRDELPGGRLQFDPALVRAVATLLNDDEPILSSGVTSWWEKGREPHSDTIMLLRDPPDRVCRAWCALEAIHPSCGMFYVIPGSQHSVRPGLYDAALVKAPRIMDMLRSPATAGTDEARAENRFIWRAICEATAEQVAEMERHAVPLLEGDVVLFDPNVIHGTMPALDSGLTRKALICEWHARDVRSYDVTTYFGSRHDLRDSTNGRLTADTAQRGSLGWHEPGWRAA